MASVSQMNKRLEQLNSAFSQTTQNFVYQINLHQTKFTHKDLDDFQVLINKLKKQVNEQINLFFTEKIGQHKQNYENKITKYTENAEQLQFQLFSFRTELQRKTIALKEEQSRNQIILDHFSKKFYLNTLKKRHLSALKNNVEQNLQQRSIFNKADNLYKKNLIKKVFFPWRSLTYRQGYENTIVQQTQHDIQNIHTQYQSIINILKSKIKNTDEEIKLKKVAKGQFSYALSKNLMKTISNLSLKVISLNQISLNDGQYGVSREQKKLMTQIDKIIESKIKKVNEYKENLLGQNSDQEKQRKIRFV